MTKQLHYDHNSFTQSVLAIFLNTIYKTELEQHHSQNLKFFDGQIQIFDYVDVIAKYSSLTKRPSYAGINLKDQGRVSMMCGVIKDIKNLMINDHEKKIQIQEKLKYFQQLFVGQYVKKWILNYLTYTDFWIFQLSYEIQKYSAKTFKKYSFLNQIRSNILSIEHISQKANNLVQKLGYNQLPQQQDTSQENKQQDLKKEEINTKLVDNVLQVQTQQNIDKITEILNVQKIQQVKTEQYDAETVEQKLSQAQQPVHHQEKVGKFKQEFIIQSKQNAIDGDRELEQKIDMAFQQNESVQKQQVVASQPINQPQDSQVREQVQALTVIQTPTVQQVQIIKNQKPAIIQQHQTKTIQVQRKTQETSQNKENISVQNIQIKNETKVLVSPLKEQESQQQVQQIKSQERPISSILPQFDPTIKRKEQPVKKQAGCCQIY